MNACERFARELDRAILGDPGVDTARLDRHAATCASCRHRLRELELLPAGLALAFPADDQPPEPRVAFWDTVESPVGRLFLATGEDGRVRRVTFRTNAASFVDDLLASGWLPIEDRRRNNALAGQLDEFFAGRRQRFDLAVDLTPLRPFHRAVLEACARVPFGGWDTYGGLAAEIGSPGAARAVGNALGANPVPLVVPCHRILAAGGRIGGYGGGTAMKRQLLALEGVYLV
jgi:methylated-DNA-[protein]-cysteine S-methyltransferase